MQKLQDNPYVFWFLATIAVGSFVFAFYTYEITKPSRQLVYRAYSQVFSPPDHVTTKVTLESIEGKISPGNGYINQIDLWNSGNLEIEREHIIQPIKIRFSDDQIPISIETRNVPNIVSNFDNNGRLMSINFNKIFPKAGIIIYYFSKKDHEKPELEGLIADPIHGTLIIRNNALPTFSENKLKTDLTYSRIFGLAFGPIMMLSAITSLIDIKPQTRKMKFAKNFVIYGMCFFLLITFIPDLYNLTIAKSPL